MFRPNINPPDIKLPLKSLKFGPKYPDGGLYIGGGAGFTVPIGCYGAKKAEEREVRGTDAETLQEDQRLQKRGT